MAAWRISRGREAPAPVEVEPGAPSWWMGDEEASQSFIRAMGVKLD